MTALEGKIVLFLKRTKIQLQNIVSGSDKLWIELISFGRYANNVCALDFDIFKAIIAERTRQSHPRVSLRIG